MEYVHDTNGPPYLAFLVDINLESPNGVDTAMILGYLSRAPTEVQYAYRDHIPRWVRTLAQQRWDERVGPLLRLLDAQPHGAHAPGDR